MYSTKHSTNKKPFEDSADVLVAITYAIRDIWKYLKKSHFKFWPIHPNIYNACLLTVQRVA